MSGVWTSTCRSFNSPAASSAGESSSELCYTLLERFKLITDSELNRAFEQIAHTIVHTWQLTEQTTQIAATTYDDSPDSGQFIVWGLKAALAEKGWERVRMVNQAGKIMKMISTKPQVVLVDEFVGTGKSMVGRIKWIQKSISGQIKSGTNLQQPDIYICTVACMKQAVEPIEQTGAKLFSVYMLEKGITGYYTGAEQVEARENMSEMESRLALVDDDGEALPSFGYGSAEALYKSGFGHVPNSVFPVFWWPDLAGGGKRKTLFHRRKRDAE